MNEISKQLASDHWNYIEKLLKTHVEDSYLISVISFHYQTAFIHGFKHGTEWLREQIKEQHSVTVKRSFP